MMDCAVCGGMEAAVFLRRSGSGEASTLALCEACARARGISAKGGRLELRFEDLLAAPDSGSAGSGPCPSCGGLLDTLLRRGRLGCPACAATFREELARHLRSRARPPFFRDPPPAPSPSARAADSAPPAPRPPSREGRDYLEAALGEALADEDYETAALVRDRLGRLAPAARAPARGDPTPDGLPPFLARLLPGGEPGGTEGDVVLETSARLVRNPPDRPFASPEACDAALPLLSGKPGLRRLPLSSLPRSLGRALVERGVAGRAWAADASSLLFAEADASLAILVGEGDTLLFDARLGGLEAAAVARLVAAGAEDLAPPAGWAFDRDFGYLSSRVERLGSGLCLSASFHLPALALAGVLDRVLAPLLEAGFAVRGFHGSDEGSVGDIFEVMTDRAYGWSSERQVSDFAAAAAVLAGAERRARAELAAARRGDLLDGAGRGLGLLLHARRLEAPEAARALSALRLALLAGLAEGADPAYLGSCLLGLGPGSLAWASSRADGAAGASAGTETGPVAASTAERRRSALLAEAARGIRVADGG